MIWTIWRQHRAQAAVGATVLAGLVAAMIIVGSIARDRAGALGLPACLKHSGGCGNAVDALHRDFHSIPPFTGALVAVPLLAGMFWAAPLVSREYEAGTHRLAWTQSVSPLRWITMKITIIASLAAVGALVLGLLANWALDPLTPAFGGRYNSSWYDGRGIVPAACMLFAFGVGLAASALIRRTIPAMAVTLVVYAAARTPVHWFRAHFAPLQSRTVTMPMSALLQNPDGDPLGTIRSSAAQGDWLVKTTVFDPSGHAIRSGIGNRDLLLGYCPELARRGPISEQAQQACAPHLSGSFRSVSEYQSASHFWLVQAVESAIFVGLADVLVAAAIVAVTRRRPI